MSRAMRNVVTVLAVMIGLWFGSRILFELESFQVAGEGMLPLLQKGDRFFVSKPLSCIFSKCELRRGEIWAFLMPNYTTTQVKRVIGLPGDEITIANGVVMVNGETVTKEAIAEKTEGSVAKRFIESFGDKKYEIISDPEKTVQLALRFGHYKVPPDSYFVLGDNRDLSMDSRWYVHKYRFVKRDQLIGRVQAIWWRGGLPNWLTPY